MQTAEARAQQQAVGSPIPKVPTGIEGLDAVLEGGLPLGRTTLIGGGPGSGKTVLALEFLYRGAVAGESGLFVSFEERREALQANAAAIGWDVNRLEEAGTLRVIQAEIPHHALRAGEFDIQGLLAILDGQSKAWGAKRMVLDAVDVPMRIFGDPERERQQLYVLHDWLRDRALTSILTVKTDPDGKQIYPFLDFMADCVLYLDQRMAGQVRTRRLRVVKYRGSDFLSNEYPYVMALGGVVLMPISMASLQHKVSDKWVSSGNADLDEILGGGYRQGSCILVTGPTGVGKTTLASLFAAAACRRGERVLYISFEEAQESIVLGMLGAGIDLGQWLDKGTLRFLTAMPEAMGVEEHLARILVVIKEFAPRHMVLDAISACIRMGSEEAAFDFLVRLLSICKERGVTCLFTNQASGSGGAEEISGMGISSLVDTCLILQFADDGREMRRRLVVMKSRGSAHSSRYHDLIISNSGIRIGPQGAVHRRPGKRVGSSGRRGGRP
jgi:circadian clock protein KaiC